MLKRLGKTAVIWLPYLWLAIFFLAPSVLAAKLSLSQPAIAMPPYIPAFDFVDGIRGWWADMQKFSFENFVFLTEDALYWKSYLSSLQIAAISTFLTLLIGFPLAYGMARAPKNLRPLLLMLVILPFWTSFLDRKSTRLNSSHLVISYAVFCLKKKIKK